MKKIAIISDTHGLLRPEVTARLAQADVIFHAGDINTQALLDTLRSYGELYIVRGNNDKEWAENLPQSLAFAIEGIRFFLIHNKKDIPTHLTGVDVVVYGHSHKYAMEDRDGVLWFNPGSCGRRRFNQEINFAMMEVDSGCYQIEKISIPHKEVRIDS